jgi:tetratricopeptide (TPR) repeat protein
VQKTGPSWILYNLAALYWRIVGNSAQSIECIRRSLYYAPQQYVDVPLVNLAGVLYRGGRPEESIYVLMDALSINPFEVYFSALFKLTPFYRAMGLFLLLCLLDEL